MGQHSAGPSREPVRRDPPQSHQERPHERDKVRPAPEVRLVVPYGEQSAELRIWTPDRPRTATIRFGSPVEGRRRALLAALDLLRRAIQD